MARPSLYNEWTGRLIEIEGWARDGLNDEQIAKNIGISTTTLYDWKNKYPEFAKAIKKGKTVADREVENALFRRAIGYEYEEVTEITGDKGSEVRRAIKRMPPDVTAQIFWLKNRKPAEWRDKQIQEITGNLQFEIVKPDDLT